VRDEYLDPEYLPEVLPHREGETAEIFELLKPVASGKKPVNVFIYGPAGIGKTAVSKFVSKTFSEERVRGVYINCWYHRTEVAVLAEALRQLSYPVPRKGRSVDELVEDFVRNSEGERLVFIMDEIDALTDDGALYILSRAPTPIGIVMISNDPFALRKLDQRARSSLAPSEIEFRKYSVEELDSILQERARLAFREFDPVAIKVAARFAFKNGSDVRYGLSLLQRAGRLADKTGQPLGIEHIKAVEVNKNPKKEERQEELKGEHKIVVEALKSLGGSAPSLEVFAKYLKDGGKGAERTFRKYVRELIELKVLTEEDIPGRGKRRLLKLSN
jgi:cell division control protein 6